MQRQLDDDLRESEMEVLMNHTRHCPDCAAMFDRLTRLSEELNNLPKVTPAYSLVDAIMPELIRIDAEAKGAETTVAPAAVDVDGSMPRRTKRTRRWPSWKSIGGVVAAGIVAGIFLVNFPPQFGANDQDGGNALYNYAADINRKEMATKDVSPLSALTDPGGDAAGAREEGAFEMSGIDDQAGEANGFRNAESLPAPDSLQRNEDKPDTDKMVTGTDSGNSGGAAENAPEMGIAGQALVASPDGRYVAHIDQQAVLILSADDGSTLFQGERKNGSLLNLLWNQAGSELAYEVSLEHGSTQKYVIDVPAFKERKAD